MPYLKKFCHNLLMQEQRILTTKKPINKSSDQWKRKKGI